MVAELELQHYQVNVVYLGFMNQYFICVQLIKQYDSFIKALQHKHYLLVLLEKIVLFEINSCFSLHYLEST